MELNGIEAIAIASDVVMRDKFEMVIQTEIGNEKWAEWKAFSGGVSLKTCFVDVE